VTSKIPQPELRENTVVGRNSLQYYWVARRGDGPVTDVRIVSIQTDVHGNVLRTQVLASS
jgi:hypothetical protein